MNIKSVKKSSMTLSEYLNHSTYVGGTLIFGGIIMMLVFPGWFSWGVSIGIVCIILIFFLLVVHDEFDFLKFILSSAILILISTPGTIIPLMYDYENNEVINEVLPIEENVELLFNKYHSMLVLLVDNKPLILDFKSDTYNRLKAGYLAKELPIEKRKVKSWVDDEATVGYYIDDYQFR